MEEEVKDEVIKQYKTPMTSTQVASNLGLKRHKVDKILHEAGVHRNGNRLYTHRYNYFENIDSYEKAYWLGFIMVDGYIDKKDGIGIEVHPKDIEILIRFKKIIEATNPIKTYNKHSTFGDQTLSKLILTSNKTKEDLLKLGVTIDKSYTAKFPNINENFYWGFIRGYFDGDGSIMKQVRQNGMCYYSVGICGTKEILKSIEDISGLEWDWSERHPDRDNNNFQIAIAKREKVERFLSKVYEDEKCFKLNRKFERFKEFLNC